MSNIAKAIFLIAILLAVAIFLTVFGKVQIISLSTPVDASLPGDICIIDGKPVIFSITDNNNSIILSYMDNSGNVVSQYFRRDTSTGLQKQGKITFTGGNCQS